MGKKRTLAILLVIPFIISLLTFVSVIILDNAVASDILGINWDYDENEGFQIREQGYELKAEPIIDPNLILANGNDLIWYSDDAEEECISIEERDGAFYLTALNEGECEVICSNRRGTVSKHFNAVIFKEGAMIINPVRAGSNQNIDSKKYYGAYDLDYSKSQPIKEGERVVGYTELEKDAYTKKSAAFELKTKTFDLDGSSSEENRCIDSSSNVTYKDGVVTITGPNENSFVTLEHNNRSATYYFSALDAVNVYDYDDLLMATNFSTAGESVVLQTNLLSLSSLYESTNVGTESQPKYNYSEVKKSSAPANSSLFGHFSFDTQSFAFEQEYYTFETTYDSTYIDYYNAKYASQGKHLSKDIIAGIRVQKDFYGNGYSLNLNGLCYPNNGSYSTISKKLEPDPNLDYFHGPLPYVSIGDPTSLSLISALGQDNCALYIDSDSVTVNDVKISNADNVSNLYNLSYTGTIVDINAEDVTIKNSILSYGKVCLRAYDADDLTVDNCILNMAGEFSMMVGSNQKLSYDKERRVETTIEGNPVSKTFSEFFTNPSEDMTTADGILNDFLNATINGTLNSKDYLSYINTIQGYLDNTSGLYVGEKKNYAASITINDTLFGRSGVFSLASESIFNGAYLYGNMPSMMASLLEMVGVDKPLEMGGTSLPVHIDLTGDTRFYDWKDIDSIDVSSLILENITLMLQQIGLGDHELTIDEVFPMKTALKKVCKENGLIYTKDGVDYINTALAYYGGGLNISDCTNNIGETYNTFSDEISVSLMNEILNSGNAGLRAMLVDCVVVTIGSHDFRFVVNSSKEASAPLISLSQGPEISTLKEHLNRG